MPAKDRPYLYTSVLTGLGASWKEVRSEDLAVQGCKTLGTGGATMRDYGFIKVGAARRRLGILKGSHEGGSRGRRSGIYFSSTQRA